MVLSTKVPILMVKKKDKENSRLQMAVITKENLSKMKFVDMESIIGLTENNMRVSGIKIRCMVMELSYGKTKRNIKDNSSMTNVKVRVLSVGLMEDNMLENGKLENSTDMELILA